MSTKRAFQPAPKVNEELVTFIKDLFTDKPIAFHPMIARAVGSTTGAIFLSQLLYWLPRSRDGWVYKTREEIYEETSLTRREQESARAALRTANVLKERRAGVPARLYFTVDWEALAMVLGKAKPRPGGTPPPTGEEESTNPDDEPASGEAGGPVPPSWSKTYQLDGTERTSKKGGAVPTITENTTESTAENVVVAARDALKEFGLSDAVASELASAYPEAYLMAKLDHVRWLVENNSTLVSKNPAGYLRRAIEQDYLPPPTYQTPDQRQAAAEAKEAAIVAEQEERRQAERAYAEEQAQQEQQLRELYPPHPIPGTDRTTAQVWDETLGLLRAQVVGLAFEMFIKNSVLTQCAAGHATIVAPSHYNAERLATHHDPLIRQTLGQVLGQPVRCTYVSRSEALTTADDPSPSAVPHGEGEPRLTV